MCLKLKLGPSTNEPVPCRDPFRSCRAVLGPGQKSHASGRPDYSWPNGPCQVGRPEARLFWPGPSTARHDLNGPRHGTGPLVLGPAFDLRQAGRHSTARLVFLVFLFYSYFTYFFEFLGCNSANPACRAVFVLNGPCLNRPVGP